MRNVNVASQDHRVAQSTNAQWVAIAPYDPLREVQYDMLRLKYLQARYAQQVTCLT